MKAKNLKAKDINGKSGKLLFEGHAFIIKIMAINIVFLRNMDVFFGFWVQCDGENEQTK